MELRTVLPDDDIAGYDVLAAEALHAQALTNACSRPLRLEPPPFLCAISLSFRSGLDRVDPQPGEILPMADLFALTFLRHVVEENHFARLALQGDGRDDGRACHCGLPHHDCLAIDD